jgi:phage tail-like protein
VIGNGSRPGWLADQLPRVMAEDHFTRQFLRIFEDIAGGIRSRVVGFEDDLDVDLAPPEFVRWMGAWLGLALDPSMPEEHQRGAVRAAGALFPFRGTRRGVQGLLEALTRSSVEITDNGGVFRGGQAPTGTKSVTVKVADAGALSEQNLFDVVKLEIPADATFDLRLGRRKVKQEGPVQEDLAETAGMPTVEAGAPDAAAEEGSQTGGPEAPPPPPPPPPPKPPKPPKAGDPDSGGSPPAPPESSPPPPPPKAT